MCPDKNEYLTMGSTSKSPSFNGANGPFSSASTYSEEAARHKERNKFNLYAKAGSLSNITAMDITQQNFSRTIPDFNRGNTHRHYTGECKEHNEGYLRNRLPAGETEQRFSPDSSRLMKIEKTSGAERKKAKVLKEQTNYASSNDIWLQQKKIRPSQELLRNKKSLLTEQGESFDNGQYLQQDGLTVTDHYKHAIANNSMGITHAYQTPEEQQLSYASNTTSGVSLEAAAAMHIAKSYGAPQQRFVTDMAHSSLSICGGDDGTMIHNQPSAKWNPRLSDKDNRKFYSEKKYEEHCRNSNESKAMSETSMAAMNASSMTTSPAATDLSQHRASSSGNSQLQRDNSINKTFPHVILSSQPQEQVIAGNRNIYTLPGSAEDKEEKRYNVDNFKPPVWGNFETPQLFTDQQHSQGRPEHHHQHPYEATFCTDCNSTGIPIATAGAYDMNPLLLKENEMLVKHERASIHPPNIPMGWGDKGTASFDKMLGSMYKPGGDRTQYYLKPPPVDLDDLSEDERERMKVKRERNRVAAAKCRNRRRELLERLEKEAEQLEREQEVLRENVKRLQAQKRKLGNMLDKHEQGCSNNIEENAAKTFTADAETSEKSIAD